MKALLMLLVSTTLLFNVTNAQIPPQKLLGKWQLIKYDYGNGQSGDILVNNFKKIKIIANETFTVLDIDPATNIIQTSIMGGYLLNPSKGIGSYNLKPDSSVYREYIIGANKESSGMMGHEFYFGIKLDDDDLLHQTGSFNGFSSSEVWTRVREDNAEDLLDYLLGRKAREGANKIEPRILCLLKLDGKEVEVIPNKSYPRPFSVFDLNQVGGIEIMSGAEAIKSYGIRAHHGVFILGIKSEFLKDGLGKLEAQNNIQ